MGADTDTDTAPLCDYHCITIRHCCTEIEDLWCLTACSSISSTHVDLSGGQLSTEHTFSLSITLYLTLYCEPVWPSSKAGKWKDLGLILLRLSFLFRKVVVCGHRLVTLSITSY